MIAIPTMSSIISNLTLQNLQEVVVSNDTVKLVSPLIIALIFGTVAYRTLTPKERGTIRSLGGIPVITAWTFFTKRYDFLWHHFNHVPEPMFKFKVLHVRLPNPWVSSSLSTHSLWYQHTVVATRGDEARKVFFDSRSLDFNEGYKILMGAVRPQ